MVNNVTKYSAVVIVLTTFFVIGSAVYEGFIGLFNFPTVIDSISNTINYVFDLIFGSMNLLSFFIRPTTLSYISRAFCFIWLLHFEFKFMRICIKLTIRLYEVVRDLLGKSSSIIMRMFGI